MKLTRKILHNHRKSRTYMRWLTISKLPLQARLFACVATLDCQLYVASFSEFI